MGVTATGLLVGTCNFPLVLRILYIEYPQQQRTSNHKAFLRDPQRQREAAFSGSCEKLGKAPR